MGEGKGLEETLRSLAFFCNCSRKSLMNKDVIVRGSFFVTRFSSVLHCFCIAKINES